MRLINTTTYQLESHFQPPPYAILSHTWRESEEVLYDEFQVKSASTKQGYRKIYYLCSQARHDGLELAWIDTVCIDKASSAELSEAINSMFRWYKEAEICYVYLDDAENVEGIQQSRWISRGWTLQELLAPRHVQFFDRDWNFLGTKMSLVVKLTKWTQIDQSALEDAAVIKYISAATRMQWMSLRQTTRIEDMAYCLLGIFDVNLPLLYGEREKSFIRLQEEILRQHHDMSLLVFNRTRVGFRSSLLAANPAAFALMPKVILLDYPGDCEVMDGGLKLTVRIQSLKGEPDKSVITLRYRFESDVTGIIGLVVHETTSGDRATRVFSLRRESVRIIPWNELSLDAPEDIILDSAKGYTVSNPLSFRRQICHVRASPLRSQGFRLMHVATPGVTGSWNEAKSVSEYLPANGIFFAQKFIFVDYRHDEAFVVMLGGSRYLLSANSLFFLGTRAKPLTDSCASWLAQEHSNIVNIRMADQGSMGALMQAAKVEGHFLLQNTRWDYIDTQSSQVQHAPEARDGSAVSAHYITFISLQGKSGVKVIKIKVAYNEHPLGFWVIDVEPVPPPEQTY